MAGFRYNNHGNTNEMKDSLTALQHYPAYLKKCAENIESLISQEGEHDRQYLLDIKTLNRSLEQSQSDNASLQNTIERYDRDCKRYRRERNEAIERLNNTDVQILEREINELKQYVEWVARQRDAEMKRYQASYDENIRKQREIQHLEEKIKQRDLKIEYLEGRLNSPAERTIDGSTSGTAAIQEQKDKQLILDLREQLQQALVKLNETQDELDETKSRLSKVTGDKLPDNNPDIADLSDKNRPTKLSERYVELYDNQWTDAFDVVYKYFETEERTISALSDILQDVMNFCKGNGHKQMENLQRVMAFSDSREYGPNVPNGVLKQLKDCRKAMSSEALTKLYKMYISSLEQSANQALRAALYITPFVKECVKICWLMVIQDPPVVFAAMAHKGSVLNANLYKPYTSSGTHVDYVVWPALLLHEGGPVLAKGVAQGYRNQARTLNLTPLNARGTTDEKTRGKSSDAQYNRYRQDYSDKAGVDRSSGNSNTSRDDSQTYQQVATVGPIQTETSHACK